MKKRRFICIFLIAVIFFSGTARAKASLPISSLSAEAAVLITMHNGEVIYSKNSDMRLPMASTTKIMTAITVIESCNTEQLFTIPKEAANVEGSSAYLKEGERLTIEELLYALMLSSANDAAAALAIAACGSVDEFARLMNENAKGLGLKNTHFTNPHGLDDAEHYSSAKDLALIMAYAMKNEVFREITASKSFTCSSEGNESRVFTNHNKLLDIYQGCNGGKTGFTKRSGRCLVSCAEKNGLELICVTLNAPDDWQDHAKLLDCGFDSFELLPLVMENNLSYTIPVINGEKDSITATAEPCKALVKKDCDIPITSVCELDRFYYADIKKGEVLGKVVFYQGDTRLCKSDIIAKESVRSIKYKSFFQRLLSFLRLN